MKIKQIFSFLVILLATATIFFSSAFPAQAQSREFRDDLAGQCRRSIVDGLKVREFYGTDERAIKTLAKGEKFTLTGNIYPEYKGYSWYQIFRPGIDDGWVAGGPKGKSYLGYCQ